MNLELWDVSGSQSKLRDRQSWLRSSDAAIIMVDIAQPITFENALRWYGRSQSIFPWLITIMIVPIFLTLLHIEELLLANPSGLPVVVCTWKPTSKDKMLDVDPETLLWLGETEDVQFYDVASDISRFDQPLLCIVRKLMNDPDAVCDVDYCQRIYKANDIHLQSFWFPYTLTDDDLEIHD